MTQLTSDGIEVCRKCCGGHGYHAFSGLPTLYEDYVAACTYEGENTVMALQTARYIYKAVGAAVSGTNRIINMFVFDMKFVCLLI